MMTADNPKEKTMHTTKTVKFDVAKRGAFQGDLAIVRLTDEEAAGLGGHIIKRSETGDMRLLEGEVTGHHHTILRGFGTPAPTMFRDDGVASSLEAETLIGTATLHEDTVLLGRLPWLTRRDLAIGFLHVEGGAVMLGHPEHDAISFPEGTYYVGRQIESAGAAERIVAD